MDRELPNEVVQKKKNRMWLYVAFAIAVVVLGIWTMRNAFFTSVHRADIRTAVAEIGAVENTLTASGEVRPEYEQLLASPITAVLEKVYLNEGAAVEMGTKILDLDKTEPQRDFEKQKDQLALKQNSIVKLKLELDKSFYDLKISDSIKLFRINALKADLENTKRLFRAGGGTREAVDRVENDLKIAQLEKKQLENDLKTRQAIMQSSIRESEISTAIQEKDLAAFGRKLQQADIMATRSGVLTYVHKNIGSKINEGETLARLADLGSFKVLGSISDNYVAQMRVGMPVIVRVGNEDIRGSLINIYPSVTNNIITFDVVFDEKNIAGFRPNMKVEVYLVTDSRPKTVRVANGAAFKGAATQDVFVLRSDGKLERRTVKIGLRNFDFVEILEGISNGETVVVSDLSKYKNATVIDLK
jgi:HlyD family secretion protein